MRDTGGTIVTSPS